MPVFPIRPADPSQRHFTGFSFWQGASAQEVRRYFKGLQHRRGGNPFGPKGADIASVQRLQPLANRTTLDGAPQTLDILQYSHWRRVV